MKSFIRLLKVWAPVVITASFVILMWVLLISAIPRVAHAYDSQPTLCEFIAVETFMVLRFRQQGNNYQTFLNEYPMINHPRTGHITRKIGKRVYTQFTTAVDPERVYTLLSSKCDKHYKE